MNYVIFLLFTIFTITLSSLNSYSQRVVLSDIINGGVSVVGVSTGQSQATYSLQTEIPDNSTIKNFYLSFYAITDSKNNPLSHKFKINNVEILLENDNSVIEFIENNINLNSSNDYKGHRFHLMDLTENISDIINFETLIIEWNNIQLTPENCPSCMFGAPTIIIFFENENFSNTQVNLIINQQPNQFESSLNINNLPKANFSKDIGLSVQSDRLGGNFSTDLDGYEFIINDNFVGILNKIDFINDTVSNSGVMGNFVYFNGQLKGITDDTENFIFNGSDGILIANNYLNNSIDNIQINFKYLLSPSSPHNYLLSFIMSYETNCDVFETQTSRDTVICLGEIVPIFASGGQTYEWEPQIGLSCYDCPNPIFNHDSTITYTVRIWNNDSCSKVLPVRVRVHKPQAPQISTTPSLCADSTGSVTFSGLSEFNAPYTYQLLGVSNASGSFANVPPGAHTYSITDKYGCVYEGTATVGVIPPKAQFTANPEQGQEPLTVTFNNSSQNANGYIWIIGTDTFYTQTHTHTFDTAGQYQVLLIAYNNSPECADTAMFTVNVFAQFYVLIPNIFTPNGDGVNDEFTFEASRIREAEWEIFNRWGSTLHKGNWSTEQAFYKDTHIIPVWNGITQRNEPALDGVYFYKITVKTLNNVFETFTGNVTLVR